MIKVNLLRSKGPNEAALEARLNAEREAILRKEAFFKVLLMVVFTVFLILYENYTTSSLRDQTTIVQGELAEIQAELERKKSEIVGIKELEEQSVRIKNKLDILKTLSRLRLREVKSLDFIQSIIPNRIWLTGVIYEMEKYRLLGGSLSADDLSEFLDELEKSPYFSDVVLVKTTQETSNAGSIGAFEVSFRLETGN